MSILLYNAEIFQNPNGEWLLVRKNKIEKIGKGNLPSASRKIDLHGALIIPGFCDSHTHLSNVALMHSEIDLTGKSREEILKIIREECGKRKIVIGRGWDESLWEDRRYLTMEEIDSSCPNKIVVLIREDGHMAAVNSYTAKRFGIESEDGVIKEKNLEKIIKKLKIGERVDLDFAQNYALSKGVTCVHDFANTRTLRAYFAMHSKRKLKIRIYANFYQSSYPLIRRLGLYSGFGDEFLKIGALKLFADGSIGARTAATEYEDGKIVEPMLTANNLKKIVMDANSRGIRVFTHAIGDLAISEVIDGYRNTNGNRIEHFELVRDEHLDKLKDMNVVLSMQPNFLKWAKIGGLYHHALGKKWLKRNNPYRKIIDSGIKLLFGSDCMPLNPLFGIKMATASEYEAQRISFEEAIKAYTIGAKYMSDKLGEIKKGFLADLVAIRDEKVILTMVDGRILYTHA